MTTFILSNGSLNMSLPLPIRQNNPMALILGSSAWEGKINCPITSNFECFSSVEYGIRAGMLNLINAYFNEGYNTIDMIINKYAPPSENDTTGYINYVSAFTGFDQDEQLTADNTTIKLLSRAIINQENGIIDGQLISDEMIVNAYDLLPPDKKLFYSDPFFAGMSFWVVLILGSTLIFNNN